MAQIFPSIGTINLLKEPPTDGERAILLFTEKHLLDEYEVYFQPYFNGLRPDIVIMRRGWGVIIVEVKDWKLNSYVVDEKNNWTLKLNQANLLSPFQQVFNYKKSMFDLHIKGLAENNLLNHNFYNILKPFVYFHGSSKTDINSIFELAEQKIKSKRNDLNSEHKNGIIDQQKYDKQMDYMEIKARQLMRDKGMALCGTNLNKLQTSLRKHPLFSDEIYEEFKRYLQPPFHTKDQGKTRNYDKMQMRLSQSSPGFQKIKGVAGCGKTTILANRAVNAHKRHNDRVLILTFNLTLKNYIHDRISDVRDDFSWSIFDIINYHSFVRDQRNKTEVPNPKSDQNYFEEIYSNEEMFKGKKIQTYQTIFIDEAQDFEKAWIKIIRKYFLADGGEMVLFSDESQNIYNRDVDKANSEIIRGFGRWVRLKKSYRSKEDSPLTRMISAYQTDYLVAKYDIDITDSKSGVLFLDILQSHLLEPNINLGILAKLIFRFMKVNKVHPNDICILAAEIAPLRIIEEAYKRLSNEQPNTTFETQEVYEKQRDETDKQFKKDSADLRKKYPKKSDADIKKAELERKIKKIRQSKKYHFWSNRGTLKLSTVHSFKGLEAQNIIYILGNRDTAEIVYTGITRSRRNLIMLLPRSTKWCEFFEGHLDKGNDLSELTSALLSNRDQKSP